LREQFNEHSLFSQLKATTERPGHFAFGTMPMIAALALSGCGLVPQRVSLSAPQIQPLLKAMDQVDRAALGFTPVTTNARINLELRSGGSYDAMLHVYGATSRTIAFRKTPTGYRWISEQEIYNGPKWYQSVNGTFREHMVVEFQIEPENGIPTNQLYIRYNGSDTNLTDRKFTLAEVRPILEKWSTSPVEPQPPDLPGAGFDPAPAMFVLFMILALLAGCCLALMIGAVCVAIFTIMLAAGIVSTSLLLGILGRSASAGFRALFIQLGALAGMAGGAIATSGVTWLTHTNWNSPLRWVIGVVLGLSVGILFAWLFNQVWSRIAQKLSRKLAAQRK
jgi:hypothetical protein